MKNKVLGLIQAAAAVCMVAAIKIWAPVCGKMLELVSGKQVPMKCHWAGQAAIAISVVILVAALLTAFAKQGNHSLMAVNGVAAVMLFLVFTSLIGVCASTEMRCQSTALWGKICAGAVLICSLIGLIGGKEGQLPD